MSGVDLEAIARALDAAPDHQRFHWAAGYITGVLVSPHGGSERDSVESILGADASDSDPRAEHIVALHREIVRRLATDALVRPDLERHDALKEWCAAFMHGISRDDSWFDDVAVSDLHPVCVLAGHEYVDEGDLEPGETREMFIENARRDLDTIILGTAKRLTRYRKPRGRPLVGRNDPCPCGSRKKYKHCCLR